LVDFTRDDCDVITDVLENDLKMLRDVYVMDYSLLLIIAYFPKENDPELENVLTLLRDARYQSRIFKSKNKKLFYVLGIIDYLQKFNSAKFFENKYKSIVYGNEIKFVSAVDPILYADRMFNFAKEYIFVSHNS
jgi:hypothetical protein